MHFKDEKGAYVIKFGTGDVNCSSGLLDIPNETIGVLAFEDRHPSPIGTTALRGCDNCMVSDNFARLVFTNIESVYAVIDCLNTVAELMEKDNNT